MQLFPATDPQHKGQQYQFRSGACPGVAQKREIGGLPQRSAPFNTSSITLGVSTAPYRLTTPPGSGSLPSKSQRRVGNLVRDTAAGV